MREKKKNRAIRIPPKTVIWGKIDPFYLILGLWFGFQVTLTTLSFLRVDFGDSYWVTKTFIFGFLLFFYWVRNVFSSLKGKARKKKRGHLFVAAWMLFVVILAIIKLSTGDEFKFPYRAVENSIYIFSVFFGRNIMKIIFRLKTRGKRLIKAYIILLFLGQETSRAYCQRRARKQGSGNNTRSKRKEKMPYAPHIRF